MHKVLDREYVYMSSGKKSGVQCVRLVTCATLVSPSPEFCVNMDPVCSWSSLEILLHKADGESG